MVKGNKESTVNGEIAITKCNKLETSTDANAFDNFLGASRKLFLYMFIKCICNPTEIPSCPGFVSIPEAFDAAGLINMKIVAAREKEKLEKKKKEEKHRWRRHEEMKKEKQEEKKEKEMEREEEKKEKTVARCSECGWMASSNSIKQYWDDVAFTRERLKAMDNDNLSILL